MIFQCNQIVTLFFRNATFESLSFLSAEQIVADIGVLVQAIRDELNAPNVNVILWGSGYGASLATWARREFPDLVQGMNRMYLKNRTSKCHINVAPMTHIITQFCRSLVIKRNIPTKSIDRGYVVN